ncbi:MAG TPA: glycosyltransferase [Thermotogota bacterium]|nr:glycosyltransferase [Thermotogota bacterium]HRW34816.1 glycosyltransferase [Thermotogota bacterium]
MPDLLMKGEKIGQICIQKGLITPEQLDEALDIQRNKGGRIGWILSSMGYIKRIDLFRVLSQHYSLKFATPDFDRIKQTIDQVLFQHITRDEVLEWQAIPYQMTDEGRLIVLNSYPGTEKTLLFFKERFKVKEIEEWVITDLDLVDLVQTVYADKLADDSIFGLFYREPDESAYRVFSARQVIFFAALTIGAAVSIFFYPLQTLGFLIFIAQMIYLIMIGFKFLLTINGSIDEIVYRENSKELAAIPDSELPVYTILIPVFKEPDVIKTLIEAVKKFDYPQNKLDVILLLEEKDKETYEAAKIAEPPSNWRFLIIPPSQPQTKPKACNYGLFFSRGEYLVIYDAEDIPEPDQLKKAYLAFKNNDESYICFQGALNYFNKDQNLLTKLFTLEYSYWFDYMLPGLFMMDLPIPLGGTSNHFKVDKLREIGGWDPFNTTEDADLGIRASAESYRVGIIRSTTYEEANPQVWNWIRQRSRWVKGYMQTTLVYNRHPVKMIKVLGLKKWLSFQFFIGGTPLVFLINPILWGFFILWLTANPVFLTEMFTPFTLGLSLFNFLFGNFLGIYMNLLGAFRRRNFSLIPISLLNPFYWLLHSAASYKALWQLLYKPHYWEKTVHGLSKKD